MGFVFHNGDKFGKKIYNMPSFGYKFCGVGHGTFSYGYYRDGDKIFKWVYDCGAKGTKKLKNEIKKFKNYSDGYIDILVVSHFDDDHVNGVADLINENKIGKLILPYMGIANRLLVASGINGDCSASTALFQLRPEKWLASNGLEDKVGGIAFVVADDYQSSGISDYFGGDYLLTDGRFEIIKNGKDVGRDADVKAHFLFFNSAKFNALESPGGKFQTKVGGKCFDELRDEIDRVIEDYGLERKDGKWKGGGKWRDELQKIYIKNFGGGSKERNNISLCMLVYVDDQITSRFVRSSDIDCLSHFEDFCYPGSLLFLGDVCLDKYVISEMKSKFPQKRWEHIHAIQIPHHGSSNSFGVGVVDEFDCPNLFINCTPAKKNDHHPSKRVVDEINVFCKKKENGAKIVYANELNDDVCEELVGYEILNLWEIDAGNSKPDQP